MKMKALTALCASLLIAACGQADAEFEAEFREGFASSCMTSATGSGASEADAKAICDCSVEKVVEEHDIKLAITPAKANDIIDRCIAETGVGTEG